MPSTTLPNTTCLPSNHEHGTVVRKNCDPFVFLPALALIFFIKNENLIKKKKYSD